MPEPLRITRQGCFFTGGRHVPRGDGRAMQGQMFVQFQVPAELCRPEPVVMIHGTGQTGANFLATPDGRPGWAEDFLRAGYAVYVIDQAGRGRSGQDAAHGAHDRWSAERVAQTFTDPASHALYPQARLHSQWPGGQGCAGDPVFDQFYASQVDYLADPAATEALVLEANLELLERIGPTILLTHSQSGVFGWKLADARPDLVRAILAVEPNGPPFFDITFHGGEDWCRESTTPTRPWGITRLPLSFEPPPESPADLALQRQEAPDGPGLVRCWMQAEPARQLPRLQGLSIAVVTGEASYRATCDHCTVKFLRQAGVEAEHLRLEEHGLHGNGHMLMLEANSAAISALVLRWLAGAVRTAGTAPPPARPRY
jgi:pimeloyl-ACP methyl ester carboxylesterase